MKGFFKSFHFQGLESSDELDAGHDVQPTSRAVPRPSLAGHKGPQNELKRRLEIVLLEKQFLENEMRKQKDGTQIHSPIRHVRTERRRHVQLQRSRQVPGPQAAGRQSLWSSFKKGICHQVENFLEDFNDQPEEATAQPEEPLNPKKLTENLQRLERDVIPLTCFFNDLTALFNWTCGYLSTFFFVVYMYVAWQGWTIPAFLLLVILRFSLNFVISKGWKIHWTIIPELSHPVDPPKEDLTISEKFHLFLEVAQKAQNLAGQIADVLEKLKNLFTWVHPGTSAKVYFTLWGAFLWSCLLPYQKLGFALALSAGLKVFLVDFLFNRYPKLRLHYDIFYIIWTSLPTDPQLMKEDSHHSHHTLSWLATAKARMSVFSVRSLGFNKEGGSRFSFMKKRSFTEIFNLPESEQPLQDYKTGWRCCLINRDKRSLKEYFGQGVLYLTENNLCFCYSFNKVNKVIQLTDITDLQKFKIVQGLPGTGMGISIATPATKKPLIFYGLRHRDRVFDAISSQLRPMVEQSAPQTARRFPWR